MYINNIIFKIYNYYHITYHSRMFGDSVNNAYTYSFCILNGFFYILFCFDDYQISPFWHCCSSVAYAPVRAFEECNSPTNLAIYFIHASLFQLLYCMWYIYTVRTCTYIQYVAIIHQYMYKITCDLLYRYIY